MLIIILVTCIFLSSFTNKLKEVYSRWHVIIAMVHVKYCSAISDIIYEPRSDNRVLLAIKVKSEKFTDKKDLAVVNIYRKFEEIIFTNNKDMSV